MDFPTDCIKIHGLPEDTPYRIEIQRMKTRSSKNTLNPDNRLVSSIHFTLYAGLTARVPLCLEDIQYMFLRPGLHQQAGFDKLQVSGGL